MNSEVKEKKALETENFDKMESIKENEEEKKAEETENELKKEKIDESATDEATSIDNEVTQKEEDNENNLKVLSKDIKTHKDIVQSAKISQELAKEKYDEYIKADLDLEKTTINFIQLENNIIKTTVDTTMSLLDSLNANNLENASAQIAEIQKDNKEELMHIKTPSKGSIKGLLVGSIGALITLTGAFVAGAKIAKLPINSATLFEKANLDKIATKYSELINIHNTPIAGYALIGVVSLLVGAGLYKLITWMQKKSNIKYVTKVEQELANYIKDLNNKIEKIKKLKQHIENIQLVMQKYDIILQEQNAKIRRMLFIEQPEDGINSLQRASKLEIEKTILILDELLKLMNTPVNEGINITQESDQRLHSANSVINEVIRKLYI